VRVYLPFHGSQTDILRDWVILIAVIESTFYYCPWAELGPRDRKTLHGLILLTVVETGIFEAIQQVFHSRSKFSGVEENIGYNCDSVFENVWDLAGGVAAIILNSDVNEPRQWIVSDRGDYISLDSILDFVVRDWFYRLLKLGRLS
jgi:urea transporter